MALVLLVGLAWPRQLWELFPIEYGSFCLPPPSWLGGASAVAALEGREADAACARRRGRGIGNLRALATRIMLCRVCVYVCVYVLLMLWYVSLSVSGRA